MTVLFELPDLHDDGLRQLHGFGVLGINSGAAELGGGEQHVGQVDGQSVIRGSDVCFAEQGDDVSHGGGSFPHE